MADPEVIHTQMEETRTRLAESLDKLTRQTTESVQEVATSVTDTVAEVQESVAAVSETVQETVTDVKDFFDIPGHVDRAPWLMFGGAMAVGFLASYLLTPPRPPRRVVVAAPPSSGAPTNSTGESNGASRLEGHWPQEEPKSEAPARSWLGAMTETFGPAVDKLKGLAIGAAMGLARNAVTSSLSGDLASQLGEAIDDVTVNLGGQPVQQDSADQHQDNPQSHDQKGPHHEHGNTGKVDRPVGANPR